MLRGYRTAAGISQEELAGRCGLSVRAISDIERGRTARPYQRSLRLLADGLGLPEHARDALLDSGRCRDATTGFRSERGDLPAGSPFGLVPRQLPIALPHFVGRIPEQQRIGEVAQNGKAAGVIAISGMPGIGKTALAVHWAHQAAASFPDGQLFLNMHGFEADVAPMSAEESVRYLLLSMGVPAARIPADLDSRIGLYRSVVADKALLLVLDNVRDAGQVRALLPGSAGSVVIVTSRTQLTGLSAREGAHLVSLDVLADAESLELLCQRIGSSRVASEPDACALLVDLCGGLPLALAILAARAGSATALPLAAVAKQLTGADVLSCLDTDEQSTSIWTALSWSYLNLTRGSQRMFRLIGIHPGPDITAPAAASLAGIDCRETDQQLRELVRASLLAEQLPGRFALHDLVRQFASRQAERVDSDCDRRSALGRVLDHYLHTCRSAAFLMYPARDPIALPPPMAGVSPEPLDTADQALIWLGAERRVLLRAVRAAAAAGFDSQAWQIPWTTSAFLDLQGHWEDWLASGQVAVDSAVRCGDRAAQARAARGLGGALARLGRYAEARVRLDAALRLYQDLADPAGQARCNSDLSWLSEIEGKYDEALAYAERAHREYESAGHALGSARVRSLICLYHGLAGHYGEAIMHGEAAVRLNRHLGNRHAEAESWESLGYARSGLGDHDAAVDCYRRALALYRSSGDKVNQAQALSRLGDCYAAAGNVGAAVTTWQLCADLATGIADGWAEEARIKLSRFSADPRSQAAPT